MNTQSKLFFPALILLMTLGCKSQVNTIQLYVGAQNSNTEGLTFGSINEALQKATEIRSNDTANPITINVAQGDYYLDASMQITPVLNHLRIIGEGQHKVTLKGSKKLLLDWNIHSADIWVAKLPNDANFDQLIINGKKQVLARYPNYDENGGHWQGHAADAISSERIKTWSQPVGAVVHAMHAGEWGGFHFVISGTDKNGEAILEGGHQNNRTSAGIHKKYRMVENVFEELDSPGEWFLDKTTQLLYYWPEEGIELTKAVVEGVHLKNLLEIKGDENNPVKDVLIQGIKFEHAKRTINEVYEPLLRSDWTMYRGGAVFITGAEDIDIKDCEFTNLGGNVIFVSNYNRNVNIEGNHIHDCGASAISFVGNPSAVRSPSFQYYEFVDQRKLDTLTGPLNNQYPKACSVNNNLIHRIGRLEKQTAGVEISMAMDITVSNNSIYEVPRAGINVSEGTWGGHIVEYNDVFGTVLESGDHGAFNSWGRDRFWHPDRKIMNKMTLDNPEMPLWDAIHTTIIRNNRFKCNHGWDIDLDDGSTNYEIYNNLCLNGGLKLREGFYRTVENNILINNGFHPHVWFKNSGDRFRHNIVMTAHKDIRLESWGKEVDYNLFPDMESLLIAQNNGTDLYSAYGDPKFLAPEKGNYTVTNDSLAKLVKFKNFAMDSFGVKKPSLRKVAKTAAIPMLWSTSGIKNSEDFIFQWLGADLKNIETLAERSASGLSKTAGVLIIGIAKESIFGASNLEIGDVIVAGEGQEINKIPDLMKIVQGYSWKGTLNLEVVRNQKNQYVTLSVKK